MKPKSSPAMHDIYKIILTHYPNDVWNILKTKFKSSLFNPDKVVEIETWDENLLVHKDDINLPFKSAIARCKYIDVQWNLSYIYKERPYAFQKGAFTLLHEIKTGNIDVFEISKNYIDYTYYFRREMGGGLHFRFVHKSYGQIFKPQHNQLWVWAHSNKIMNDTSDKRKMRVCHLEWIDPLIDKLFDEIA